MKWRTIYTNSPVNAIVKVSYPRVEIAKASKRLPLSVDIQTRNYDTE